MTDVYTALPITHAGCGFARGHVITERTGASIRLRVRLFCVPEVGFLSEIAMDITERHVMADTFAQIAFLANAPHPPRVRTPISRAAVRSCDAELQAVVARLAAADPVGVRGVARLRSLLSDGTGPLYGGSSPGRLRRDLRAALEALDAVA